MTFNSFKNCRAFFTINIYLHDDNIKLLKEIFNDREEINDLKTTSNDIII